MAAVTPTKAAPKAGAEAETILSLNNIEVVYDRVILGALRVCPSRCRTAGS